MDLLLEQTVGPPDSPRTALVFMTDRSDGDVASTTWPADLTAEIGGGTNSVAEKGISFFRQVHGARVRRILRPGDHRGAEADAGVTHASNAPLAVRVADCVPVGLVASNGTIGVAHAGWRGLQAGVLESAVGEMRAGSADRSSITAVVGPCIGPECYEFGAGDLDILADQFGDAVRSRTRSGTAALDMGEAVRAELTRLELDEVIWSNPCTACDADRFWSWRARAEAGRQAMVVVLR